VKPTCELLIDAMYLGDYRERIAAALDASEVLTAAYLLSCAVEDARAEAIDLAATDAETLAVESLRERCVLVPVLDGRAQACTPGDAA